MKSAWDVTVTRSYFSGTRAMRRAVGHHRSILEEDPDFTGAYQVPGVYDYGIATLPRALRMLAFLFGVRGDKERGLDWLARTAQEGERSRWGALWARCSSCSGRTGSKKPSLPSERSGSRTRTTPSKS